MYSIEILDIVGSRGETVPNTFFRQKAETDHLAVLLPGIGYTSHMPVMYYPCLALLSNGADVLRADYNYAKRSDFMSLEPDDRRRWAAEDAIALLATAMKQRKYAKMTLAGKSIGTSAMGYLITTVHDLPTLQCIWMTPLLKNEQLLSQIKRVRHRALFVTGTSDPHFDQANLDDLQELTGGQSIVIAGADHSMEIGRDPIKSIQALERIMKGISNFLAEK